MCVSRDLTRSRQSAWQAAAAAQAFYAAGGAVAASPGYAYVRAISGAHMTT
jgi:hypothetical protein